ncbi:MAG: helix-turn-helix domain-containing protein [Clostridiales bacterium]|nr:helix-turn-helix domain-containing protein [Clostridiales bacterium]
MADLLHLDERFLKDEKSEDFFCFFEDEKPKMSFEEVFCYAIEEELTSVQRDCIKLYYCENKSVVEIADILELHRSVIYRHIENAKNKLYKVLKYAFLMK